MTSGSAGAYVVPLGKPLRRDEMCGKMHSVDSLKPKKKKKKRKPYSEMGIIRMASGQELTEKTISKDLGDGKFEFEGKVGVWRTIRGKRYFFPDDGSDPTPKIPQ